MDYKATLNLPKTDFPMKANLAQAEPRMLAWWDEIGIYKRLREAAADRPLWILHDGPPYANGNIHMGHVLNKVMKDLVVKSRGMLGFNAVFVPGWDCHGLPIEHQVDKELGLDVAPTDVRRVRHALRADPARGVQAPGRLRRLGQPVHHDGARVSGGHRARVRPLRRPRPRVQGPQAGALV